MTDTATPQPQPAPEPDQDAAGGSRRLTRPVGRPGLLAGVAAGLAAYSGRSRLLIRILLVALAFTGAGLLLYLAGWALIPRADRELSPAQEQWRAHRSEPAWIAALALLALALLLTVGHVLALAAIAAAVCLLARDWLVRRAPQPPAAQA